MLGISARSEIGEKRWLEILGRGTKTLVREVDYLQALAAVCRLDLAVGRLPDLVVACPLDLVAVFPPDQAAGYPPDQAADSQLDLVVGCPLDLVAVFLQGPAVVFQLGLEVECPLGLHPTAATYPLGPY